MSSDLNIGAFVFSIVFVLLAVAPLIAIAVRISIDILKDRK